LNRLDRYVFAQILGPFGFFALVFTGVIWLSQSLRIIDLVVNNGQSAAVFAEFSALLLPAVMSIVLPVSAFAASLFVMNRLYVESELVVMMGAGRSHAGLVRPVAAFGLAAMAAMCVITLYLMPMAARVLRDRMADVRGDVANALIREGQFVHPAEGITIYVRDASRSGEMAGIFIHDGRDPDRPVTYSADRAALVRGTGGARVVMLDGAAQQFDATAGTLATLRFDTFTYDLEPLMRQAQTRARKPSERFFWELVAPSPETRAQPGFRAGEWAAEGHEQLGAPLYGLVLPMIAATAIVLGRFQRRGFALQIWIAIGAAIAVRLAGVAAKAATSGAAGLWPLMYLPPIAALAAIAILLGRPGRRRAAAAPA
jgi:lipopolysaccharide export system permease protein